MDYSILKSKRKAGGITLKDFYLLSGVSIDAIRRCESGHGHLNSLMKIMEHLDLEFQHKYLRRFEKLGCFVRRFRESKSISHRELSRRAAIPLSQLSTFELQNKCNLTTLDKTLSALSLDLSIGTPTSENDSINQWLTPPEFLSKIYKVIPLFDLDAASPLSGPSPYLNARQYFTVKDDSLKLPWADHQSIWLNPPYQCTASSQRNFLDKCVIEKDLAVNSSRNMIIIVLLMLYVPDFYHDTVFPHSNVIITRGRVNFIHGITGKRQNSRYSCSLIIFNSGTEWATNKVQLLKEEFSDGTFI